MVKKLFTDIRAALLFVLLLQLVAKFAGLDQPSTDYNSFYYPNALSMLHTGETYTVPEGDQFVSDGNWGKHGFQPPGYSMIVAFCIATGIGLGGLYFMNVVFLLLTFILAKKTFSLLSTNQSLVYTVLWIMAFNPAFSLTPSNYNSEALFSLLLMATVFYVVKSLQSNSYSMFGVAMLFLAASVFTRSINLFLAPVLWIPFLFAAIGWKQRIGFGVIAMIGLFACVAVGNASGGSDTEYQRRAISLGLRRFPQNETATALNNTLKKGTDWQPAFVNENLHQITTRPFSYLGFWVYKSATAWYATDSGNKQGIVMLFQLPHMLCFWLFLVLAIIRKRMREPHLLLFAGAVGYTLLLSTVNFSIARYMIPVAPLYIFISVWLVATLFFKTKNEQLHAG